MSLRLDQKVIKWLIGIGALDKSQDLLSTEAKRFLQNGIIVAYILDKTQTQKDVLDNIKNSDHFGTKIYNWNIINQCLKKIQCQITTQQKTSIINGDSNAILSLMDKLYKKFYKRQNQLSSNINRRSFLHQLLKEQAKQNDIPIKSANQNIRQGKGNKDNAVVVSQINGQKQLQLTQSILQFLLVALCKHLLLTSKQAISLLSEGNKYLAHVLVKGVKGNYQQIQNMLGHIYKSIQKVVNLVRNDQQSLQFFLQAMKPSLLSKNIQVALWGARIYTFMGYEIANMQMLGKTYQWFCKQNGGLYATILCLKRHPQLVQSVSSFLLQFGRHNISDLFTIQLHKFLDSAKEYINILLMLFRFVVQSKVSKEDIVQNGALDYWIELAEKHANDNEQDFETRANSIMLLNIFWIDFPLHIQETAGISNQIITLLKKGQFSLIRVRSESKILQVVCLNELFNLLNQFAHQKNPFASVLYKKITFLFVQNHSQQDIRENILSNLLILFSEFRSIPVQIFLQPFIKQIQASEGNSYNLRNFDLSFIRQSVTHPRIKQRLGILYIDILIKIFLNSKIWSQMLVDPIIILIQRFIKQDHMGEYIIKMVKVNLAVIYAALANRTNKLTDHDILTSQKNALIFNMLRRVIQIHHYKTNDTLKPLVAHIYLQIKQKFGENRGMKMLLEELGGFGILEQYMEQCKMEQLQIQQQKKSNSFLPQISRPSSYSSKQSFSNSFPIKSGYQSQQQKKIFKKIKKSKKKQDKINPKVIDHLHKLQLARQVDQDSKVKKQLIRNKKKQQLKHKLKGQVQKRKILLGVNSDKLKLFYQQGQISQKLLQDKEPYRLIQLQSQQPRDCYSAIVTLRKYKGILTLLFNIHSQGKDLILFNKLLAFFKENGMPMDRHKLRQLLKQINHGKEGNILKGVNFQGWLDLWVQMGGQEIRGIGLEELIRRVGRAQNVRFDDQDQKIRQINQQLRHKQVQIPDGFKKYNQKVLTVKHSSQNLPIPQSYKVCYEVVNDLFYNAFKSNIMQGELQVIQQRRVKRVNQKREYKQRNQNKSIRDKTEDRGLSVHRQRKQKGKKIDQEEQRIKEGRRKKRAKQLEKQLENMKVKKQQKNRQIMQKQQQEKAKLDERKKRNRQKQEREDDMKKAKLAKFKQMQKMQRNESKKKMQEQLQKQFEVKAKQQKKFISKQNLRLKQNFQKAKNKRTQQQIQKQKKLKQQQQRKQKLKNKIQKVISKQKHKKTQNDQYYQGLQELITKKSIIQTLDKHQNLIKSNYLQLALFSHYVEYNDYRIDNFNQNMEFKGFNNFVHQNGIVPKIVNNQQEQLMFKNIMKKEDRKGINRKQFQLLLLDITVRGKNILDKQKQMKLLTNLGNTTGKTIQHLFDFMKLPQQKKELKEYLKLLKQKNKFIKQHQLNKSKGKLQAVNLSQLQKAQNMQVINPQGKKQNWDVM